MIVALVAANVGKFTTLAKYQLNPHIFFDHQTSDSLEVEMSSSKSLASQNLKKSIITDSIAGIDAIIPIVERGDWCDSHDTEPGEMWYHDSYTGWNNGTHELPLPLCINETVVDTWYLDINVTGGYVPYDLYSQYWWIPYEHYGIVQVFQKGDWKAYLSIVDVYPVAYDYDWSCWGGCGVTTWRLEFDINGTYIDCFTIDSNQYPITFDPDWHTYDGYQFGWQIDTEIPGKDCFEFDFWSYWTGCSDRDQAFVLILV